MIDNRIKEDIFPVKIIDYKGNIDGIEKFTTPVDLQIGTSEASLIHITGKAYVVLDFGMEYNASVRILTHTSAGGATKVRIRCGESVSECCAERGVKFADNHHTARDSEFELVDYSDMSFFETGFRFVRLDFPENTDTHIKTVTAVYVHRDLTYKGGFTCNDNRVNEIFDIAARTLTLNMQRYIWDGIKRDRLVWVGDMHPETMGIISLFGEDNSVIESLEYARAHTPLPEWINSITAYSMWWVVVLADYYRQNGDTEYILGQRAYIDGVVRQIETLICDNGAITTEGALFDWPSHEKPDEVIGLTALAYLAASRAKELFKVLSLDITVCDRMLEKLSAFNEKSAECKQCEAMKVYAGMIEPESAVAFLTEGNAKGLSTFMSYYILDSIAAAGKPETALAIMKEYYGAMLDKGATTFWEDFDVDWVEGTSRIDEPVKKGEKDIHGDFGKYCYTGFRHSLCHGWSCGPVAFLIKTLGGIEPVSAGCKSVEVNPVSAGLTSYSIKYPTPYGTIDIELKSGVYTVTYPKKIKLVLPVGRTDIKLKKKK